MAFEDAEGDDAFDLAALSPTAGGDDRPAHMRGETKQMEGTFAELCEQLHVDFDTVANWKKEAEDDHRFNWKSRSWAVRLTNKLRKMEEAKEDESSSEEEEAKPVPRTRQICTWKEKDADGDVWWCNNHVITHPLTKELLYHCGYHQPQCLYFHPGEFTNIDMPNELGACSTHFISIRQKPPRKYHSRFDVPGTVVAKKNMKGTGSPTHPLAPPKLKRAKGTASDYTSYWGTEEETESSYSGSSDEWEEEGIFAVLEQAQKKFKVWRKQRAIRRRSKKTWDRLNRRGAVAMQMAVRGWIARRELERMKAVKTAMGRAQAAERIQIYYKGRYARRSFVKYITDLKNAVYFVERHWKRVLNMRALRDFGRKDKAARTLGRFYVMIEGRRFLSVLRAKMQAKKLKIKRLEAKALLWRVFLGYQGRSHARARRSEFMVEYRAAQRLQAIWKGAVARLWFSDAIVEFRKQNRREDAALKIQRIAIGYLGRQYYRWMFWSHSLAAIQIQRIWRGIWGRIKARKRAGLSGKVWRWFDPSLPKSTFAHLVYRRPYHKLFDLEKFLKNKPFKATHDGKGYAKETQLKQWAHEKKEISELADKLEAEFHDADVLNKERLTRDKFVDCCLRAGFHVEHVHLMKIVELFTDQWTGTVDFPRFVHYARQGVGMCARHRLLICPLCMYTSACKECRCNRFRESARRKMTLGQSHMSTNVCVCGHHKNTHITSKPDRRTVSYQEGMAPEKWQLDRLFAGQTPPINEQFVDSMLKTHKPVAKTEAVIDGPRGEPVRVMAMDDMPSLHNNDAAEGMVGVAEKIVQAYAAKADPPVRDRARHVYPDADEHIPGTDYERVYNFGEDRAVDLLAEDGRGIKYPAEHDQRRPSFAVGDEVTRGRDRHNTRVARVLAGYAPNMEKGYNTAVKEALDQVDLAITRKGLDAEPASLYRYRYTFDVTRPVPIIREGDLKVTLKMADVYVYLFRTLGEPPKRGMRGAVDDILRNHNHLMSLIYSYNVFLDRFWRKLLHDIRVGTLDEALPIPEGKRRRVEANAKPQPTRAAYLEEVFRALGYHQRASMADRVGMVRQSNFNILDTLVAPKKYVKKPDLHAPFPEPYDEAFAPPEDAGGSPHARTGGPTTAAEAAAKQDLEGRLVGAMPKRPASASARLGPAETADGDRWPSMRFAQDSALGQMRWPGDSPRFIDREGADPHAGLIRGTYSDGSSVGGASGEGLSYGDHPLDLPPFGGMGPGPGRVGDVPSTIMEGVHESRSLGPLPANAEYAQIPIDRSDAMSSGTGVSDSEYTNYTAGGLYSVGGGGRSAQGGAVAGAGAGHSPVPALKLRNTVASKGGNSSRVRSEASSGGRAVVSTMTGSHSRPRRGTTSGHSRSSAGRDSGLEGTVSMPDTRSLGFSTRPGTAPTRAGVQPATAASPLAYLPAAKVAAKQGRPLSAGVATEVRDKQTVINVTINLNTLPRPRTPNVIKVTTGQSRPWLCPHPGCGRSFPTEWKAVMHYRTSHLERKRLSTPSPLIDNLSSAYWPGKAPWNDAQGVLASKADVESADGCLFVCDMCGKRLMKQWNLDVHKRVKHQHQPFLEALKRRCHGTQNLSRRVRFVGEGVKSPPNAMPNGVSIPACMNHAWLVPHPECEECNMFEEMPVPHAPLTFYDEAQVKVIPGNEKGLKRKSLLVVSADAEMGVMALLPPLLSSGKAKASGSSADHLTPHVFAPLALCRDRTGQAWMIARRCWTQEGIARAGCEWHVKNGFDERFELLESTRLEYVPMEAIVGDCFLAHSTAAKFRSRQKEGKLPTGVRLFYTRERADKHVDTWLDEMYGYVVPDPRAQAKLVKDSRMMKATSHGLPTGKGWGVNEVPGIADDEPLASPGRKSPSQLGTARDGVSSSLSPSPSPMKTGRGPKVSDNPYAPTLVRMASLRSTGPFANTREIDMSPQRPGTRGSATSPIRPGTGGSAGRGPPPKLGLGSFHVKGSIRNLITAEVRNEISSSVAQEKQQEDAEMLAKARELVADKDSAREKAREALAAVGAKRRARTEAQQAAKGGKVGKTSSGGGATRKGSRSKTPRSRGTSASGGRSRPSSRGRSPQPGSPDSTRRSAKSSGRSGRGTGTARLSGQHTPLRTSKSHAALDSAFASPSGPSGSASRARADARAAVSRQIGPGKGSPSTASLSTMSGGGSMSAAMLRTMQLTDRRTKLTLGKPVQKKFKRFPHGYKAPATTKREALMETMPQFLMGYQ